MFSLHTQKEDYFLTASRMVPYKRMDLVVEAFSRMPDKRLVVIGDGPEMPRIKSKAGKNVTFLGHQPVDQLRRHLQLAKAFVFAAEEDFGIAPLEAQACGTPVIAFGRGGVRESVISGETGLFFDTQSPKAIVDAVHEFEAHDWDYAAIRRNAERFSSCRFRNQFVERIRKEWAAFKAGQLAVKVSPPADDPDILEAIAGAGAGS
jgi:glycosyltransferase involved in cell wall biosynthesis